MLNNLLFDQKSSKLSFLTPSEQKEIESWVVNSVKVKMIKKLDELLEEEGRTNARKLFLVPVFTVLEIIQRVETTAPEIKTFFYKELISTLNEAEKKLS